MIDKQSNALVKMVITIGVISLCIFGFVIYLLFSVPSAPISLPEVSSVIRIEAYIDEIDEYDFSKNKWENSVVIGEAERMAAILKFLEKKNTSMKAAEKPILWGTHKIVIYLKDGSSITYAINGDYIRGSDKIIKSNLDIGVSSLSIEEKKMLLKLIGLTDVELK